MIQLNTNRLWYHSDEKRYFGINVGQRMTIIRLHDDSLLVYNPGKLTNTLKRKIEKIGLVSSIITVNQHLDQTLSDWWLAYPNALFYSAPCLASKRTDIRFDGILNSTTSLIWKSNLCQTLLRGNDECEEIIFCDTLSKTLILGESLLTLNSGSFLRRSVGILHPSHPFAQVALFQKLKFNDLRLLRRSLQEILTWPFDHILPVYGDPVFFDGKRKLAKAYSWLLKNH